MSSYGHHRSHSHGGHGYGNAEYYDGGGSHQGYGGTQLFPSQAGGGGYYPTQQGSQYGVANTLQIPPSAGGGVQVIQIVRPAVHRDSPRAEVDSFTFSIAC